MDTEEKNCWEFMGCSPEKKSLCSAYKNNMGKECWMIAGSASSNPDCIKIKKHVFECWDCPWYKKVKVIKQKKKN